MNRIENEINELIRLTIDAKLTPSHRARRITAIIETVGRQRETAHENGFREGVRYEKERAEREHREAIELMKAAIPPSKSMIDELKEMAGKIPPLPRYGLYSGVDMSQRGRDETIFAFVDRMAPVQLDPFFSIRFMDETHLTPPPCRKWPHAGNFGLTKCPYCHKEIK